MIFPARGIFISLFLIFITGTISSQDTDPDIIKTFQGLNQNELSDTLISLSQQFSSDNPDTALYFALSALSLIKMNGDESRIAEAAYWVAEAYTNNSKFREAIEYYRISADAEFILRKDSTGYFAERLSDIAYCYQELGIYEQSLTLYEHSLKIQKRLNNIEEVGDIQSNIGSNYFYQGKYDKSLEYYEATLQIDRSRNDSSAISVSLNNIGMLYGRWGKMEQAIAFFEESLNYTNVETKKAIRLSNIGTCYFHLGESDKALEYLNTALELDQKNNQQVKIAIRKNEISNVLASVGQVRKAISMQKEALTIFEAFEIRESEAITLTDLGDIYRRINNLDSAETCYLKSNAIAHEIKTIHHIIRNYKSLYELAEQKEDHKRALEYYKLFASNNDSVYSNEKHDQLARFEILFETEKKEKANQLLTKDLEISRKTQRMSTSIIISLFFITGLLFYLFRVRSKSLQKSKMLLVQEQELSRLEYEKNEANKKMLEDRIFAEQQINRLEREKYHAEIEYKNRELANATLCLVNKNEILIEIRDKIKSDNQMESLPDVVRFINSNTDMDLNWNKFSLQFNKIHSGFSDRLRERFSNLTDHDYRLCTYLRINLSSREIAGMMSISLDAVNKHRQRLRKKLNLEPESDISRFLELV